MSLNLRQSWFTNLIVKVQHNEHNVWSIQLSLKDTLTQNLIKANLSNFLDCKIQQDLRSREYQVTPPSIYSYTLSFQIMFFSFLVISRELLKALTKWQCCPATQYHATSFFLVTSEANAVGKNAALPWWFYLRMKNKNKNRNK